MTATIRGTPVPKLGLGTWQLTGDGCREAVRDALAIGYRHVDTARAYGNEREVGEALRASGVPREEVWVTSKIWPDDLAPARLRPAAEDSLQRLGIDRLDLLLVHWPNPEVPLEETLGALVALREEGLIRELGVSNFPAGMLRRALALAPVFADQVEYHPLLGQEALRAVCAEHDVLLTAYAPLAHGQVLREPVLREIAAAHGTGPAQVGLRWLLDQPRVAAVPKAATAANRRANLSALDVRLTEEDRARIDALPKARRAFDPPWAPDWDDL